MIRLTDLIIVGLFTINVFLAGLYMASFTNWFWGALWFVGVIFIFVIFGGSEDNHQEFEDYDDYNDYQ